MKSSWDDDGCEIDSLPEGPRLGGRFHPPEGPLFRTLCGIAVVTVLMSASVGPLVLLWFDKVDVAGAERLLEAYSDIVKWVVLIVVLYYFRSVFPTWHRPAPLRT